MDAKTPHGSLRATVPVFRAVALLMALVGGVVVLIAAAADFPNAIGKGLAVLLVGWLGVALACLTLFAFAELIVVVLDIENRTRHLKVDSRAVPDPAQDSEPYPEMARTRRRQRGS
ncbi:MAG: hypothetical protein LC777_21050 [Actinobacteria bacterium]|nr:hypothetical protein [Actinomycetota bacterium]